MKKLFSILVVVGMLLTLVPVGAARAESPTVVVQPPVITPIPGTTCLVYSYAAVDLAINPPVPFLYKQDMLCAPLPTVTPLNELVVYAHGYVSITDPIAFPQDQLVLEGTPIPLVVTGLGYYFATTTYHRNGLAVLEGLEDINQLTDFAKTAIALQQGGLPVNHTYLIGPSEGGWITALALERDSAQRYSGGLSMCGPVGDFPKQINYWGDFRVLFDYFFPGVIPNPDKTANTHDLTVPDEVIAHWYADANGDTTKGYEALVRNALLSSPSKTAQLLKVARAPYDPMNPATRIDTAMAIIWYNVFANNDGKAQLGGQPFDNRTRWYSGSTNDAKLNKKVQRVYRTVTAQAFAPYQTSGDIQAPLVTMHTLLDPVVPFWHEALYLKKIASQQKLDMTLPVPINAYGHCKFTLPQAMAGFGLMVWKATGQLPPFMSQILTTPTQQLQYRNLVEPKMKNK